jgi:hypothetical protein
MISANPANAATINVGTVLRFFVVPYSDEFYAEKVSTQQNCRRCRGLENGQS